MNRKLSIIPISSLNFAAVRGSFEDNNKAQVLRTKQSDTVHMSLEAEVP